MSNLGAYQWMTSTAKKVGGPINLLLITGATGAAIYKSVEISVKTGIKQFKKHFITISPGIHDKKIYRIITPGKSNDGTQFSVGDTFRILEKDGDAILIAKENDPNNPYFVSAKFLQTISNYKEATNNGC
jgi:hypothetical protein